MTDEPITQREADRLLETSVERWEAHHHAIKARWEAHMREHELHLTAHEEEHRVEHLAAGLQEKAVDAAFEGHSREHTAQKVAVEAALAAVDRLADTHQTAHKREHDAHEQRHQDQRDAVTKAEGAMDKRLETMNGVYNQMRDMQGRFASSEAVTALVASVDRRYADSTKHTDERYEENRRRIENLEKGSVKVEGKGLGQTATLAAIIATISVVGTILGILIVLANFVTSP